MWIPGYRRTRTADAQLDRIERIVRYIMATQNDLLAQINATLQAVDQDVSSLQSKVQSLESQLAAANDAAQAGEEVDLQSTLDLASNIRQHLEGTGTALSNASTAVADASASQPTDQPTVAGGEPAAGADQSTAEQPIPGAGTEAAEPPAPTDQSAGTDQSGTGLDQSDQSVAGEGTPASE